MSDWNQTVEPTGDVGGLVDWLKAIAMRQEHDHPFKVIGQAAARITADQARIAELEERCAHLEGKCEGHIAVRAVLQEKG